MPAARDVPTTAEVGCQASFPEDDCTPVPPASPASPVPVPPTGPALHPVSSAIPAFYPVPPASPAFTPSPSASPAFGTHASAGAFSRSPLLGADSACHPSLPKPHALLIAPTTWLSDHLLTPCCLGVIMRTWSRAQGSGLSIRYQCQQSMVVLVVNPSGEHLHQRQCDSAFAKQEGSHTDAPLYSRCVKHSKC